MRVCAILSLVAVFVASTVASQEHDGTHHQVHRARDTARLKEAIKARQWQARRRSPEGLAAGSPVLAARAGPSTVPTVDPTTITLTLSQDIAVPANTLVDLTVPLGLPGGTAYRATVTDSTRGGSRLKQRAFGDLIFDSGPTSSTSGTITFRLSTGTATSITFTITYTAPAGFTQQSPFPAIQVTSILCGTGASMSGTTCICSTGTYDPTSATCVVPPPTCGVGSSLVSGTCVTCSAQGLRDGSVAGACGPACPALASPQGATCVCSAPRSIYTLASNSCTTTCPVGSTPSGPTCVCADGTTFLPTSNQCVACSTIGAEPGVGGQCGATCPVGSSASSAGCQCADGSAYDPVSKSCSLCNSIGKINGVDGVCGPACPASATASGSTCICPSGSSYVAGACATCASQLLRDGTSGACGAACPPGTTLAGSTCTCPSGSSFITATNSCSACNGLLLEDGLNGACGLACPPGSAPQGATCLCAAVGSSFVNEACASCTSQSLPDTVTPGVCGASCPTGSTLTLRKCVCATTSAFIAGACVTCDSLNLPNGDGIVCGTACTGTQGRLNGACVDCNALLLRAPSSPGGVCQPSCDIVGTVPSGGNCVCPGLSAVNAAGTACESRCNANQLPDGPTLGTCLPACAATGATPSGARCECALPYTVMNQGETACISTCNTSGLRDTATLGTCGTSCDAVSGGGAVAQGATCRCLGVNRVFAAGNGGSCTTCASIYRQNSGLAGQCGACISVATASGDLCVARELLVNPGFEQSNLDPAGDGSLPPTPDPWTVTGNYALGISTVAHGGDWVFTNVPNQAPQRLCQAVTGLAPDQPYVFSFWGSQLNGGTSTLRVVIIDTNANSNIVDADFGNAVKTSTPYEYAQVQRRGFTTGGVADITVCIQYSNTYGYDGFDDFSLQLDV